MKDKPLSLRRNAARQRELLRLAILEVLEANPGPYGLSSFTLAHLVRPYGPRPDLETLEAELHYLAGKGLVEPGSKSISPELGIWRITASGRDLMACRELYPEKERRRP